jgi:acyl carrier protein
MSVGGAVVEEIEKAAREHGQLSGVLSENSLLEEMGLDSLCWATIVVRLEDRLGIDPFTASEEFYFPTTLGEFIQIYEKLAR